MSLQVLVDFNDGDAEGRVHINTEYHKDLLEQLTSGMSIVLFDIDGLAVYAIVEFQEDVNSWYGLPNWATRFELPNSRHPDL